MARFDEQHTVIIPSYNTLEHLKNTYKSLKRYAPTVQIIIIDDASEDKTDIWLNSLDDDNLTVIISETRKGHTYWYDEAMRRSTTDIVSILHSDMIIGPCYFENMLRYLEPGKVVCATRIEPPIHPAGKEKIVKDFGDEADTFNWNAFELFCNEERTIKFGETTKGIFAPWMLYKKDHLSIGGHDQGFAPYGYEDSDIFNRWILAGYKMIQARDSLCYHMTCRGHRWNKGIGIENVDYQETMDKGRKYFLKKWGHWIKNDEYQYPIISPVYNKKLIIKNSNSSLEQFYDWFNDIDDIVVEIDGNTFTQQDAQYITMLNDIVADSGANGTFELGNLSITINTIHDRSKDLIIA